MYTHTLHAIEQAATPTQRSAHAAAVTESFSSSLSDVRNSLQWYHSAIAAGDLDKLCLSKADGGRLSM